MLLGLTALVLVGAGSYALTRVVKARRIQEQVERLPTLSLAMLLPAATPTYTPTPTQTSEVRPTPTRIPTATLAPTITPSEPATETPQPSATATRAPATRTPTAVPPTATPAFRYPAVELAGPPNGTNIAGADAAVELTWKPVGTLAEDEWYCVRVEYWAGGQVHSTEAWLKETSWRLPASLFSAPDPAKPALEWKVQVVRRTGTSADGGNEGVPVSPASASWTLTWR